MADITDVQNLFYGRFQTAAWPRPRLATWITKTATAITSTGFTFTATYDSTSYKDFVTSTGGTVNIVATANSYIGLLPEDFSGIKKLKLNTSGNEAVTRTINLIFRGV